ncbi:MAG: molecular chaperone DnaJ [Bacilli bacterium]|nr:molecular chaperone DnaJ [Bacilli bacterium]MDY6430696.1 molecular chaperone DnaJ [Bacilli bacterium]
MAEKRDYYEVLGISKSASKDEITSAYRKLAKKYHPDINKDPNAPKQFEEVQEAYDVLKDDQKRAAYDRFGHAAFTQGSSTGGNGNPFGQGFTNAGFGGIDLDDIFSSFFGGGPRNAGRTQTGPTKGDDTLVRVKISFMDSINGCHVKVPVTYDEMCEHCHGSGASSASGIENCKHCGGKGYTTIQKQTIFGAMNQNISCSYCGGKGKVIKDPCPSCQGKGYTRVHKDLNVNIPAGINSGQQIRVQGKGMRGQNGGPNGDLYVEVVVNPHPEFKRDGNDIHVEVPLSFVDCALGITVDIPTVYGEVNVTIPEGTQPDQVLKIKDRGVKDLRTGKPGNQYIHISVKTPTKLNKNQKDLLKEFQSQSDKKDSAFAKWKAKF